MNLTEILTVMTASAAAAEADTATLIGGTILPMILMIVFFYFIFMRPQKKKEKEIQEMRSSIEIGDEIVTVGGIVGIVVRKTNEETIVIETGGDRNKIRIKLWAVHENLTAKENAAAKAEISEEKPAEDKKKKKSE